MPYATCSSSPRARRGADGFRRLDARRLVAFKLRRGRLDARRAAAVAFIIDASTRAEGRLTGYGFPFAEDYFFDSLINFVVPPQDPDGDEFYFQAAIYEADEVTVGMPLPVFSGVDDFNPLQQPEAHTFRVPKDGKARERRGNMF